MKKHWKKLFTLGFILNTYIKSAHAATGDISLSFEAATLIISIILIVLGIGLIIIPKILDKKNPNKTKKDKNKDAIVGLVDKEEVEQKKTVTVDTIFKELPTFSANKFHQDIFEDIKEDITNNLSKDETVEKITLLEKEIIDFSKNNNKYTIVSKYKIKYSTKYTSEKESSKDHHTNTIVCSYTVTSKNDTTEEKEIHKCPTCFGKIKDPTKLRCEYCDCILPSNSGKKEKWITKDIKMDNH